MNMAKRKSPEDMTPFEQLKTALEESLAHARGELTLRTTVLPAPPPKLTKKRVQAVRAELNMSQSVFASLLNVPTKTLQSWEQGARVPKASEARLLQLLEKSPDLIAKLVMGDSTSTPSRAKSA